MSFYKSKTTQAEARQALLDAAHILGFEGPGLYRELIRGAGGSGFRELVETPSDYIDMIKRTVKVNTSKGEDWQVNHLVEFVGVECVRCEAEPIGVKHPDYCDACYKLEEKPKKGWVIFSGKVKDLASADLSGGWRGPGTYRLVPVGGVPKSKKKETLYQVETMGDCSDLLRNSTACGVEKVEVEK